LPPLLPSLTVAPDTVTVLLPLPAFGSVKAKLPPESVSVLYKAPLVTLSAPAAVRLPS